MEEKIWILIGIAIAIIVLATVAFVVYKLPTLPQSIWEGITKRFQRRTKLCKDWGGECRIVCQRGEIDVGKTFDCGPRGYALTCCVRTEQKTCSELNGVCRHECRENEVDAGMLDCPVGTTGVRMKCCIEVVK